MNVRPPVKFVAATLVLFALADCATTQKIDWPARVGHYTYDQAVAEFGKPAEYTKSADGGTVADWMIDRSHVRVSPGSRFVTPGGFAGPRMPTLGEPYTPNIYLRLAFGPDGRLKDHREFTR